MIIINELQSYRLCKHHSNGKSKYIGLFYMSWKPPCSNSREEKVKDINSMQKKTHFFKPGQLIVAV